MKNILAAHVLLLASYVASADYDFKLRKPQDKITAIKQGERTVFVITNPSGIGSVAIKPKEESWPENITLRFLYQSEKAQDGGVKEKLGFKTLEGLTVRANGKEADNLAARARLVNDAMEVDLPDGFATGAKELAIAWVDAYRTINSAGLIILILSVSAVLCLISVCMIRVLTLPPVEVEEHLKAPLEIDTRDTNGE